MAQLFLDTSIQVDRIVGGNDHTRRVPIEKLLSDFNFLLACAYSRLEFKRVVIQNLALVLRYLCEEKSFWRAFRRANRLQYQRRGSTLINLLVWLGIKMDREIEITLGEGLDQKLALQAESIIRNAIRYIWKRFDKTVGMVVDRMECMRATEGPKLNPGGDLDVGIPESRCRRRECNNANFLRSNLPAIKRLRNELERIKNNGVKVTDELEKVLDTLKSIERDLDKAYDYKTCQGIGDVWIHLECLNGGVKDFATWNYKESEILCPVFGLTMKQP